MTYYRIVLVVEEPLTLPEYLISSRGISGGRVIRSLVLCVYLVDRCLYFFFWPLCCLFFDIQIMITPLVSCGHYVVCFLRFTDSDYPFWYLRFTNSDYLPLVS